MANRERKTSSLVDMHRRNRRAIVMGVLFTLFMIFLFGRKLYIQIEYGDEYVRASIEQQVRERAIYSPPVVAERGQITDRNFVPLALSRPEYYVFVDVRYAVSRRNHEALLVDTIDALYENFDMTRAQIEAIFALNPDGTPVNDRHHYVIATNVLAEIAEPLNDNAGLPDVHARRQTQRWHTDPFFAPHILGFTWGGGTNHGLEQQYNTELSGVTGQAFRTLDTHGNPIVVTETVQHGHTLITTLDTDIQNLAQYFVDRTARNIPSSNVGIIVKNPHTGEILAMAQCQTFSLEDPGNPAYFGNAHVRNNWDSLYPEEQTLARVNAWNNFHLTHSYEPGSVFKPFVIAAALEEGVISIHDRFYCPGYINIADRTVYCWYRRGHGSLSLSAVTYRSCNIAMVEINRRLGRDAFYRYRGYFGFGERTGIDLPSESDVSSPAVMYPFSQLGPVQMATSSIGQGFNSTTIQTITAFSSLINGGRLMQPHVVRQIVDADGAVIHENLGTVVRHPISEYTANWLRRDMQLVVSAPNQQGTGWRTAIEGHTVGGKTGSAQQGARGTPSEGLTLTYIAYTPVDNPEFIVLMVIDQVVDHNHSAGQTVAPIVRELLEELIELRNMRPSDVPYADSYWQAARAGGGEMPDFSGQRVTDVVLNLNNMELDFTIVGTGTIVDTQIPHPGRPMPQPGSGHVILYLDEETRTEDMVTVPSVVGLTVVEAERILGEAMLRAVLATGTNRSGGTGDYTPGTAGAVERDPTADASLPPYRIYRQFPEPGTEVERGFQVRLRPQR